MDRDTAPMDWPNNPAVFTRQTADCAAYSLEYAVESGEENWHSGGWGLDCVEWVVDAGSWTKTMA